MGRAFVLSLGEITLLGAALLSLGYFAGSSKRSSSASPAPRRDKRFSWAGVALSSTNAAAASEQQQQAFVLAVNMKFSTLDNRDTFLQLIDPVCKDVLANEGPISGTETTLSYKVAISDKNPLMVLILERYSDKENGYLTVHRSGKEFLKFREELRAMQEEGGVVIEGESYLETELGYV